MQDLLSGHNDQANTCSTLMSAVCLCYTKIILSAPPLCSSKKLRRRRNSIGGGVLVTKTQVVSPYSKPADTQLVKKFTVMYETFSLISLYHICMGRHVQERSVLATTPCLCACPREAWVLWGYCALYSVPLSSVLYINTLRTGDADLRFYITTVQDG